LNGPSSEVYLNDITAGLVKENFVVIDPNKRDLLYCLGSNGRKVRYTQPQRVHETKSKKYSRIREELTEAAGLNTNRFDVVVPHTTCDPAAFTIYLRTFFSDNFEHTEQFYRERIFRKLRFNAFVNTKKSEEKFIEKFKGKYGDGRKTSVIIGDWDSGGYTMGGQVTTKGKGFR
jgi:hypothetical protein